MQKFSEFIVRNRWWVIVVWLLAAVLIVSLSPSLSSVESNNQSSFLPKGYESVEAINIAKKISPNSQDATDLIVFESKSNQALTSTDLQTITSTVNSLSEQHLSHILSVTTSPKQLAPNHKVQLAQVTYSGNAQDTATINAVKNVRDALAAKLTGSNIKAAVTGEEAISYDTSGQSTRALKIVSIGTLLMVLVLPALIFRSPFAGLLPIAAVGVVDLMATSLLADAAKLFNFQVSQQLSVIFTVVLFGIGTDYILFLLFRYRERLRSGDHSRAAVSFALSRAGLAILSAALVVLTSFSALFFAKFGIFHTMAPGLVICVGVMMLAALTLIPALVAIVKDKVFWPSKAWKSKSLNPTISKKIGGLIAKRPAVMAAVVVIVLIGVSVFALGYKSDYSSFSQPPKGTESATGYNELTGAFPAGVLNPTEVYVSSTSTLSPAQLAPLTQRLQHATGVSAVEPAVIAPSGKIAVVSVILKNDPSSAIAITDVAGPIRQAAHSVTITNSHVYVGGSTALLADIKAVTDRDLKVIFPIAAVFIFIILTVLLRSLVAPVFLLICVGLGYVATLGTTTLIFQRIGNAPGIIFFIPLFMFIFVVAIGTDYNILTITRLREEVSEGHLPRKAADLTVEHSSATVASAGLILAATFGSLLLAGISFLSQMGAAIAIGVALSAFVIAPFLIPSISAVLGYVVWWPSHRPGAKAKR
ncbi:MAG TPA: MMPL family transporter [Candidatus Saccharimonadales bacterium]|nr:MMPL family transporter [Candidatus Saccharimonadales bacterium]